MAKVMISLSDDLLARIDEHARRSGTTRSGLLQRLAENELDATEATRRRTVDALLATAERHGGDAAGHVRAQRRSR